MKRRPQNWCSKILSDKILGRGTQLTKVRGRFDWAMGMPLSPAAPAANPGDITATQPMLITMTMARGRRLKVRTLMVTMMGNWVVSRCSGDITGGRGSLDLACHL